MGERVGGKNPKDWYRDRFGNVYWHDSQEDQIKGENGETLTRLGKSGSYINNRGTVTELNKDRTVTESGKISLVVKPTPMAASAMYGTDSPQISSPGKVTAYLSSFDTTKYYPLTTQKLQSPALVDPSASMMKAYIEAEGGVYLFRGFKGILFYDRAWQWERVGHWSPRSNYEQMVRTGRLVEEPGAEGRTFLSEAAAGAENWEAAPKNWVYSEFEVRTQDIMQGGRPEWRQGLFKTEPSMRLKQYIVDKKGGSLAPMIRNISPILKAK
ncbi:hypothetical protein ACM40_06045 [Chryseobacterium sp. BLS98]|uniref:TreTu family toxin n=1 Tax=Chryseobacterium sp. BLS98 TaxID=885586 RepID=UPI00065ADBC1|nr:hypothetical protein ACM40_06045 [Chryseobacterium sp. BLS98]